MTVPFTLYIMNSYQEKKFKSYEKGKYHTILKDRTRIRIRLDKNAESIGWEI